MNAEFFKAHTLGLPRWVWITMLVGGVGVGLYLRKHQTEPEAEPDSEEGYTSNGSLMPPAAPIGLEGSYGGGGGGGGVVGIPVSKPPETIEQLPKTEPEPVELPESNPPPEPVIGEPAKPPNGGGGEKNRPISGPPIVAPGTPGIGPGHPAPGSKPPGIGPGTPVPTLKPEKEKALAEISRLNGEIGGLQGDIERLQNEIAGLQNHIAQLTSVIQQYPNAKQRGQWENERNGDRANIDGKRQRIEQDQANIQNKRNEISSWQQKL